MQNFLNMDRSPDVGWGDFVCFIFLCLCYLDSRGFLFWVSFLFCLLLSGALYTYIFLLFYFNSYGWFPFSFFTIIKSSAAVYFSNVFVILMQDILRFHAVYWPAMLMSAGLSLPKKVFGHGFLTKVFEPIVHFIFSLYRYTYNFSVCYIFLSELLVLKS